ncbi:MULTISPECIES: amidohydrolase family protein [Paenibacillus]|uniref:amidohydrolase family protein n=1 Tax=Paenibacillus TaxID=44249 RepID=UPI000D2FF7A7|nr:MULTISPECIES: amidohydrolase family protein [Paenibacillus]KAF6614306.1 amidohydrolase family protein [Paenibacillus sp. EKM101P]KAF6616660.1 amidohydrolase family protein [Paenibacillus sp. EKM102P]KAF6625114.1 amidohydrolase family protein [Paenibacillus sp. EKM10P]KAF6640971.1 amidohydrolase family protein [Paenibacillus sp. EKM11P]PTU44256.1 imidazolonepropionase [Paenibacillus polymyxa]
MITAITNARIFDGEKVIKATTVLIEGEQIVSVGGEIPEHAVIIDAQGGTLLPGLIDAHVHTSVEGLRDALKFGVTTELEMMGGFTKNGREAQLKGIENIADVRSAGMGVTPPGGHPDELMPGDGEIPDFVMKEMEKMSEEERNARLAAHKHDHGEAPTVSTRDEALAFVDQQVREGADYIKIMIEEGTVLAAPGLPVLSQDILSSAVGEAHRHHKMVIAHVLTAESSRQAVEIGVDGLAHLFIDRPETTTDLVRMIAEAGVFVTPCLVLNSSIIGNPASELVRDPRVSAKLSPEWINTLNASFHTFPQGSMADSYRNVMDLHRAGVDILVGTDVSVPVPSLGGLAHGASVHHEMQLLVKAGFTPLEALQSATSKTARRFGLNDRGRIVEGARADLVLVDGNPTLNISDTLSIREIWQRGTRKIAEA